MLYHLTTTLSPVVFWGAITATVLFISIISLKEKRNDPERA